VPLRSYALLLLGVLALCALVGEGAAADWSAVYLHDTLGSTAGFAASGYAAFSVMMAAGRLAGDRLTVRYGPVNLVRVSGALAGLGLAAALLIATPFAGVVGFGCLGAGLSFIAPQVYSAAGNRDPARAGRALSTVVSIGYAGFVLGPILIGSVSTAVGLRAALGIPAVLALAVAAGAPILRAA
jgi:fucose permease